MYKCLDICTCESVGVAMNLSFMQDYQEFHCLLWKFHKRAKAMKLDEQVSKSSHYINTRNSFVASHRSTLIAAVLGLMSGSRGLHALSSQSLCHLTFSTAVPFPRCFTANSWETPRQLLVFLMAIKKYLRHKMHFHRPPSRVHEWKREFILLLLVSRKLINCTAIDLNTR